jgi:hypothetical protein
MTDIGRRGLLKLIGTAPLAAGITAAGVAEAAPLTPEALVVLAAQGAARAAGKAYTPQFFTAHEYATARELADIIIPRDERSGSASEAGVLEFMDFMMVDPQIAPSDREERQTAMRGGLAWLDLECGDRFGKTFLECSAGERTSVIDDIAWPKKAEPEHKPGAAFFSEFRDLTASGFWSSRQGVEDLRYQGNTFVAEWKGCPEEMLTRLGVRYDDQGERHS